MANNLVQRVPVTVLGPEARSRGSPQRRAVPRVPVRGTSEPSLVPSLFSFSRATGSTTTGRRTSQSAKATATMIITIPDHRLAFQSPVFAASSALLATRPMIVSTTP